MLVAALALSFAVIALLVHAACFLVLLRRLWRRREQLDRCAPDTVALVRTVCDVGPFEMRTLRSTFELNDTDTEIIFCAASASDPAVSLVRQLIDTHPNVSARLLFGEDVISSNAKLNNMLKGWDVSRAPWVVFADSNLLLPPDYVRSVLSAWSAGTGAVCAPPIGSQPQGLWAEVECAFLNGHQAPWQYAVDSVGFGFAQGKTMLVHRDIIERGGGLAALGCEPAEDAALTKLVRAQGLSVRLAEPRFTQPLGERTWRQVIDRQTRWAQLRRATFPGFYASELFSGVMAPMIGTMLAASLLGWSPSWSGVAFIAVWLGIEGVFTWLAGWHLSWSAPLAWLLREILLPIVWLRGWLQRSFQWGGRTVLLNRSPASVEA